MIAQRIPTPHGPQGDNPRLRPGQARACLNEPLPERVEGSVAVSSSPSLSLVKTVFGQRRIPLVNQVVQGSPHGRRQEFAGRHAPRHGRRSGPGTHEHLEGVLRDEAPFRCQHQPVIVAPEHRQGASKTLAVGLLMHGENVGPRALDGLSQGGLNADGHTGDNQKRHGLADLHQGREPVLAIEEDAVLIKDERFAVQVPASWRMRAANSSTRLARSGGWDGGRRARPQP